MNISKCVYSYTCCCCWCGVFGGWFLYYYIYIHIYIAHFIEIVFAPARALYSLKLFAQYHSVLNEKLISSVGHMQCSFIDRVGVANA